MNVRVDVSDGPEEALFGNVKRQKAAKMKAKKHKSDASGKLSAGRMSFLTPRP